MCESPAIKLCLIQLDVLKLQKVLAHRRVLQECKRWDWELGKLKGTLKTGLETLYVFGIDRWLSVWAGHASHLRSSETVSVAQAVKPSSARWWGSLAVFR